TTEIYTLSLHDALPISRTRRRVGHGPILPIVGAIRVQGWCRTTRVGNIHREQRSTAAEQFNLRQERLTRGRPATDPHRQRVCRIWNYGYCEVLRQSTGIGKGYLGAVGNGIPGSASREKCARDPGERPAGR